jgi:hypothetical protein
VLRLEAQAPEEALALIEGEPAVRREGATLRYANPDTGVRFEVRVPSPGTLEVVVPLPRPAVVGKEATAVVGRWARLTPLVTLLGRERRPLDAAWLAREWTGMNQARCNILARAPRDRAPYPVLRAKLDAAWEWNATASQREEAAGVAVPRIDLRRDRGTVGTHCTWDAAAPALVPVVDALTVRADGGTKTVRFADVAARLPAPVETGGAAPPHVAAPAATPELRAAVDAAPSPRGEPVALDDVLEEDVRPSETWRNRLDRALGVFVGLVFLAALVTAAVTRSCDEDPVTGEHQHVTQGDRVALNRTVQGGRAVLTHPRLGFVVPDPGPEFNALPSPPADPDAATWRYAGPHTELVSISVDWDETTWGPVSIIRACDELHRAIGASAVKNEDFMTRHGIWSCQYDSPPVAGVCTSGSLQGWNLPHASYGLTVLDVGPCPLAAHASVVDATVPRH